MAQGGDVCRVRVLGMDANASYLSRVLQAHVGPGLSAVSGLVNAVTVGGIGPQAGLAGASVDHVGVRIGDSDGSYSRGIEEAVGYVLPVGPAVVGLPYAPSGGTMIEDQGVDRVSGDGYASAAPEGAYEPPLKGVEEVSIHRSGVFSGIGMLPLCHDVPPDSSPSKLIRVRETRIQSTLLRVR